MGGSITNHCTYECYSWKDVGQVLEDSNLVGDAMEGRIRKKLEISWLNL